MKDGKGGGFGIDEREWEKMLNGSWFMGGKYW